MRVSTYDLAVVGSGPVGSQLAWRFAKKGSKVLILEEHDVVGLPVACSGHVSTDVWNLIPYDADIVENRIRAGVLHVNGRTYEFRKKSIVSYVLCREELDRYVHALASKAGAETSLNTRVVGFVQHKEYVDVETYDTKTKQKRKIQAKMLAGCDGPASTVRRTLGLKSPKMLHGVFCYTDEKDEGDVVELWFNVPKFFAWRIPRRTRVEYGLAVEKGSAKYYFEKLVKEQKVKPSRFHAGLIPYGMLPRVTKHRVFLCGDAASQVKPFTGGGIVYGMLCAKIAAETVDVNRPETLNTYEKAWRRVLGKEIRMGSFIKSLYSTPLLEPLVYFASRLNQERMHMDRPTTVIKPARSD